MDEYIPDFKILFNKNRQSLNVFLHDVHPKTFAMRGGGSWGFFIAEWSNPKLGHFGSIHLVKSRVRVDLVVHELDHARTDWMLSNGFTIIRQNEEKMATFLDELVRKFYREYNKLG